MNHRHCITNILLTTGMLFVTWTSTAAATSFNTPEECQTEAKKQDMEWGRQYTEQAKCHAASTSNCPNPAHDSRFDEWVRKIDALHNACDAMRYSADANDKADARQQALQEPYRQKPESFSSVAAPHPDSPPAHVGPVPSSTQQSDASMPAVSANTDRGMTADGDIGVNGDWVSTQTPPPILQVQNQTTSETASEQSCETPEIIYLPESTIGNVEMIAESPAPDLACKKAKGG